MWRWIFKLVLVGVLFLLIKGSVLPHGQMRFSLDESRHKPFRGVHAGRSLGSTGIWAMLGAVHLSAAANLAGDRTGVLPIKRSRPRL